MPSLKSASCQNTYPKTRLLFASSRKLSRSILLFFALRIVITTSAAICTGSSHGQVNRIISETPSNAAALFTSPNTAPEHPDNSAAVPAHAFLRLFERVKRFGVFRMLEIHLHGAVCKLNVNILAEPLLMNRFKLSCSTAENACQQLNYYVQSRENRRVREVLCELRALLS